MNGRPKINGLSELYSVDYASQPNIARAPIVAWSARFHYRLVYSRRAIKGVYGRLIGKAGHGHGCRAVLQRHQQFVVIKLCLRSG